MPRDDAIMTQGQETVLTNGKLVLGDRVIEGALRLSGGVIADIDEGAVSHGEDLEGDYLLPGLVELHTDRLESHLQPRPKVAWPTLSAILAHDAELTAAGITTVLDSLRLGDPADDDGNLRRIRACRAALVDLEGEELLRADHRLHIRCELACRSVAEELEEFLTDPRVALVSLMDHTPGQRQFVRMDAFKTYYQGRYKFSDAELESFIKDKLEEHERWGKPNRPRVARMCRESGMIVASHDDATEAHVEEAVRLGLSISEFPTTFAAAQAARRHGMTTIGGAPNLVRGKSHSGNVSVGELAELDLLDALASDYVPISLLHGAVLLHRRLGFGLPEAVATVSAAPARMVGLDDRGEIAVGKRADVIQVRLRGDLPVVRKVWRAGRRVI